MYHQGEEKHRLGSHRQRRHSMQKISKKQSTMKQGVKEHMIRHKQILKKVNFKNTEKVKLKNTFSRKWNEKTPSNYVKRRYFS